MNLLIVSIIVVFYISYCDASAAAIVAAARSQKGVPYVWGGGNQNGKTNGGFDCSGLAQYAVHKGTGKVIARTSQAQYTDSKCKRVSYAGRQAGDLVFFENAGHVGIITGPNTLVHAPKTGDVVKEAQIWSAGRMPQVQRCF